MILSTLGQLKCDPEIRRKLDDVLKAAYEEAFGEPLDLESPEEIPSDDGDVPMADEPAPGMEDVVHHWEVSQTCLMPFKELHEKSKTTSGMGHPYVKCQACGKALNSMTIGSFWQRVESKQCYPQSALEFWKKEHRQKKEDASLSSKKRPMEDDEAMSEKTVQEMAKAADAKRRKKHLSEHYKRFRKDEVKPEVKKIPKRPEEKKDEEKAKESEKETEKSPSRAPIELKSRSPERKPKGQPG